MFDSFSFGIEAHSETNLVSHKNGRRSNLRAGLDAQQAKMRLCFSRSWPGWLSLAGLALRTFNMQSIAPWPAAPERPSSLKSARASFWRIIALRPQRGDWRVQA